MMSQMRLTSPDISANALITKTNSHSPVEVAGSVVLLPMPRQPEAEHRSLAANTGKIKAQGAGRVHVCGSRLKRALWSDRTCILGQGSLNFSHRMHARRTAGAEAP